MATVDVLINTGNFRENQPIKMHIAHQEFKGPDGIIGQRPKDFDHFRVEKTYSHANLGLSSATAYQAIHAPQSRSMYSVLMNSLPRQTAQYKQNPKNRLPNLFQRSASRKTQRKSTAWRHSFVPSTSVQYASPSQLNENTLPLRPHTSAGKVIPVPHVNWTSSQASLSATGQSLLSESYRNRSFYNATPVNKNNLSNGTHLPHHTLVNYVPFYEHRSRGDGASIVGSPAAEKKTKSKTPSPEDTGKEVSASKPKEITEKRARSALKNSRSNSPEWPGINAKQTSVYGKQEKKRVRFSSTVNDKIEEPAYVETLLNSVSRRLQRGVKEGWATAADTDGKNEVPKNEKKLTHNETGSPTEEDDDSTNFVSPITRVTVTRRKVNTDTVAEDSITVEDVKQDTTNSQQGKSKVSKTSQQKILDMATKILNTSSNIAPVPANEDTKDIQTINPAGRNATGFAAGRSTRKGEIIPMAKFVEKKQAIISPTFPDKTQKQRRPFMSYAYKVSRGDLRKNTQLKTDIAPTTKPLTIGADAKNSTSTYKQTAPLSGLPAKQSMQYISIDLNINNLAHSPRSATLPMSIESPRSISLLPSQATHFQPIPSQPDHINFCDPGKTEHILEWLDDVNKKRNIELKLKRVSSSMSSKTIS